MTPRKPTGPTPSKRLSIVDLVTRVGADNINVQTPLHEGTFISCNKRKGYSSLEFATYPELAEELAIKGEPSKVLLVLVIDRPVVDKAERGHRDGAPMLAENAHEEQLVQALRRVLDEASLHAHTIECCRDMERTKLPWLPLVPTDGCPGCEAEKLLAALAKASPPESDRAESEGASK